jgi:hypothetical protein
MSSVTQAGFILSALFMASYTVHATSIDLFENGMDQLMVSSSRNANNGAPAVSTYASSADVSGFQFGSSMLEQKAGKAVLSSAPPAGISLGLFSASNVSPRCLVPPEDPPPLNVAPESSSLILFGIGLAALSCLSIRQRRTLDHH